MLQKFWIRTAKLVKRTFFTLPTSHPMIMKVKKWGQSDQAEHECILFYTEEINQQWLTKKGAGTFGSWKRKHPKKGTKQWEMSERNNWWKWVKEMSERNEWKKWVKGMSERNEWKQSVKKKEVVGDACRLDRWRLGAAFPSPPFQPSPGLQMSPLPVFHSFRISSKNPRVSLAESPHPVCFRLSTVLLLLLGLLGEMTNNAAELHALHHLFVKS